jgi:hypothetical protein
MEVKLRDFINKYRALLAHKLPVDRPDSEITIEQANQVLSTYLTLRNEK